MNEREQTRPSSPHERRASDVQASCPRSVTQTTSSYGGWAGPGGPIGTYIREETGKTLEAYQSQPHLIIEHANHEEDTARGGYANRQLFELVQNSADALVGSGSSRICVRLTPTHLYCADDGLPINVEGVRALMFSHLSSKRGTSEIGRFGLGFKSVLGVSDSPEFISRPGSFRFDRGNTAKAIKTVVPNLGRSPVLRLPEPFDPLSLMESDQVLDSLASWAVNIVRLPLKTGAAEGLARQVRDFPAEFLLFVEHVSEVVLQSTDPEIDRSISLSRDGDHFLLDSGSGTRRWMLFKDVHHLSTNARKDRRSLDDAEEIPISWAIPMESLAEPGRFWAFFPTNTSSLLAGILNAPWKTNEDRQNLLSGVYNDELVSAAAHLVSVTLSALSTPSDPAKHLDALPRRSEAGDGPHSVKLRSLLDGVLKNSAIAPDQEGTLRKLEELSYPPRELANDAGASAALKRWESYERRPTPWLHHSALNTNRLARLERLHAHSNRITSVSLPRSSISDWLEALAKTAQRDQGSAIESSIAAVQTAALIPSQIRSNDYLGKIVLKADGTWAEPDPNALFLGDDTSERGNLVHPRLQADPDTVEALVELGIKPASAESSFNNAATRLLGYGTPKMRPQSEAQRAWAEFWGLSRRVDQSSARLIILGLTSQCDTDVMVRTISGTWRPLHRALLPGNVVPDDGSRDHHVAIDVQFHEADLTLLQSIGAVDSPHPRQRTVVRDRRTDIRTYAGMNSGGRTFLGLLRLGC